MKLVFILLEVVLKFGKHSVIFFGENESLELTHNINSKVVFVNGALKAAEFIILQKKGFFTMKDLV